MLGLAGLGHVVAVEQALVVQDYGEGESVDRLERFDIECRNQLLFDGSRHQVCESCLAVSGRCALIACFYFHEEFPLQLLVLQEGEDKVFSLDDRFLFLLLFLHFWRS